MEHLRDRSGNWLCDRQYVHDFACQSVTLSSPSAKSECELWSSSRDCDKCYPHLDKTDILFTHNDQICRELVEAYLIRVEGDACVASPSISLLDNEIPFLGNPRANRPPKSLEQEVPRSFHVLFDGMGAEEEEEGGPEKRRRRRRGAKNLITVQRSKMELEQRGMTRPLKPLPERLEQQPDETDDQFLKRLDHLAGRAFTEATIENKFNVRVDRDEQGHTVVDPKGGDVLDENYGARKRQKRKLREQKLKEKKRQKASARQQQQQGDFGHLQDQVAFGEVVHHPPAITAQVRKADSTKLSKPGRKELLLSKMLQQEAGDGRPDLTVKRRELPTGDRQRLEAERQRAVFLYRKMKAEAALRRATTT